MQGEAVKAAQHCILAQPGVESELQRWRRREAAQEKEQYCSGTDGWCLGCAACLLVCLEQQLIPKPRQADAGLQRSNTVQTEKRTAVMLTKQRASVCGDAYMDESGSQSSQVTSWGFVEQ